jgi:hypothetical protein
MEKKVTQTQEFKNTQVKYNKKNKLPSYYFASKYEVNNPKFRTAKPGEFVIQYGCFKSGRILSVRNFE